MQKLLLDEFSVRVEQVNLGSLLISMTISLFILFPFAILHVSSVFYIVPGVLFFLLSIYLIQYFPRYYRNKSDEIDLVLPLLRNCIELYLSFIPQKSDISAFIINFLASIPSPVQKAFREKLKRVQEGCLPESILQNYFSPSKNLEDYIKNLYDSNYHLKISSLNADHVLETRYQAHSQSIESRISITLFFGFFIPLGFTLGVYLQRIRGIYLLCSSPVLYVILYFLSKRISKDNFLLLGTISGGKNLKSEYLDYWVFFSKIASNLIYMSPDRSLIKALEATNFVHNSQLFSYIQKFKSYKLTLNELLDNVYSKIRGARTKLVFGTLKFMITTNSLVASQQIYNLLTVLKTHQELENQRMITLKGEIYKVRIFQMVLPISIGLITCILLLITTNFSFTLFSFSFSTVELVFFSTNQLLSVVISVYYFRRIVGLQNTLWTIIPTIFAFIVITAIGFLVFTKITFVVPG